MQSERVHVYCICIVGNRLTCEERDLALECHPQLCDGGRRSQHAYQIKSNYRLEHSTRSNAYRQAYLHLHAVELVLAGVEEVAGRRAHRRSDANWELWVAVCVMSLCGGSNKS